MITERSGKFIAETTYANIPKQAADITKMAIMDIVGVALAGSTEDVGHIIVRNVKNMGGEAQSGVIGSGFKTSSYLAALANGTIAHAIDYDDVSFHWYEGHPSACLGPAALSLGESIGASGKDIITAYIVGFEVAAAINSLVGATHRKQGWHATSTIGAIGTAAVSAKLLKLDAKQTRVALGIAASLAGGLNQNIGTMTKPLHAGHAASSGILAAKLSHDGFTADENIIEARQGFAKVFGCQEDIDWEKASEHLGKTFIISTPAIEFKRYPSCATTTGLIDAALYLKNQYNPDLNMITEIILGDDFSSKSMLDRLPETGLEAEFSREYCACRALIDGKVTVKHFNKLKVKEPDVVALMKLTKCVKKYPDPVTGRDRNINPQCITVKLRNGTEHFYETPPRKTTGGSPMTTVELEEKYQECSSMVLDEKSVEKSLKILKNLGDVENIGELMKIITKKPAKKTN